MEKGNFSFTLTVPRMKKVWYEGKFHNYALLSLRDQHNFLENRLQKIVYSDWNIIYVYEQHEITEKDNSGRLHIHGMIYDTYFDLVQQFILKFYEFPINCAPKTALKISNVQKTYKDVKYFLNYMNKNQDKICFYMGAYQQQKDCDALDGLTTTFKEEIKPLNEEYFRDLKNHLNRKYLTDDYLHSLVKIQRNKFFIEI